MACYLVLCAFVRFYGPLSGSLCLRFVLWPVISLYVSSFGSMACYLVLCAFVRFYGPLSRSMCLRSLLWTVISLCSFVWFYGPLSRSLFLRFVLWTFISFSVPSSSSMDPHLVLCSIRCLHQLAHLFISLFLTPTTPEKSIEIGIASCRESV